MRRKTELRPTPMTRRAKPDARRVRKVTRRDTGPSPAVKDLVVDRADGCCEVCRARLATLMGDSWTWIRPYSIHHRRPRGMGGTRRPDANSPANLLLLCGTGTTGCHLQVETHRDEAIALGLLVHQADDPAGVPVHTAYGRPWGFAVLHDTAGSFTWSPIPVRTPSWL